MPKKIKRNLVLDFSKQYGKPKATRLDVLKAMELTKAVFAPPKPAKEAIQPKLF